MLLSPRATRCGGGARVGTKNRCLADLTNNASFRGSSGSGGRDRKEIGVRKKQRVFRQVGRELPSERKSRGIGDVSRQVGMGLPSKR